MEKIVMIIPPDPIKSEIRNMITGLTVKFEAYDAFFYPPHITVKSLGKIKDRKSGTIDFVVKNVARDTKCFNLTMEGVRFFGSTKHFKGVYIPVQKSPELVELHKNLVKSLKGCCDGKNRIYKEMDNYNPHLTLIGSDISNENLKKAKKELQNKKYSYTFPVEKISLYTDIGDIKPLFFEYNLKI